MDTYDLAIIGGGPAGSACALAAARAGLSVALFEAQATLCDKPCGEGLMPPGIDALRELGLHDLVLEGQPFAKLRYVLPGVDPLELALPSPGLAIDRPSLTRGLEGALRRASGVTRFFGHVNVERLSDADETAGFRIVSRAAAIQARVLVAADGLSGKSAAWLRGGSTVVTDRNSPRRAARLGVRARYAASGPLDAVEIHFSRGTEIYLTPLPQNRINVAVLVGGAPADAGGSDAILARALAEHPRAAGRLAARITAPEARALGFRTPRCVARAGTLLVGDAGGGIDPILGCGVTLALETGILAAEAARAIVSGDVSGAPERQYAREYRQRTQMRRMLATFLLTLSNRPALARGTLGLARRTPRMLGWVVNVAAGASARESARPRLVPNGQRS
jgi:menaquinone-9 beta-reductase